jgi:pimeloyl-ACP methyl ester carboxylesterase
MKVAAIFLALVAAVTVPGVALGQSVHPTSANCTWKYIEQPLSHFEKSDNIGTYQQRLCVYDGYWTPSKSLPVFLYTGNESPVEEYVDNTGLLWNLASKYNALVVFAEHRYFGESIPTIQGTENCVSYLSSEEALADYATLSGVIRREWGGEGSPVIAFGGSYGGMLASWFRIKYPGAVDGAIAASAPVLGFPLDNCPLDGSARVVSYAASESAGAAPKCADNMKASYVLISNIGSTDEGRKQLSSGMGLCSPLKSKVDVVSLLNYLQSPLFNLAEGSYPFPSNYITFALTGSDAQLPPWAMQVLCSSLASDFGVTFAGDTSAVKFDVSIGGITVSVDWDVTTNNGYTVNDIQTSGALNLLKAVAHSTQVWYNVTGEQPSCIDWDGTHAPNAKVSNFSHEQARRRTMSHRSAAPSSREAKGSSDNVCTASDDTVTPGTAWTLLTCNEGINLVNWQVQGVGNDLYWPPNKPRGYTLDSVINGSLAYCSYYTPSGLYGLPSEHDEWSIWMEDTYGGSHGLNYISNIVYSNGNLDPWQPAGVPVTESHGMTAKMTGNGKVPYAENDNGIVSVVIDMGGHHLDLFWEDENDPESVK